MNAHLPHRGPSFDAVQNMSDGEIVTMMVRRLSCPKCHGGNRLSAVQHAESENNERKGLRVVTVLVHCSSCGVLKTPLSLVVPTTRHTYDAMERVAQRKGMRS